MKEFGLDKPMWQQFFIYVGNVLQGDLGTSFGQYPASVNSLIAQALPWSLVLQVPAIIVGWVVGNLAGRRRRVQGRLVRPRARSWVRCSCPASHPSACAIILLFVFACDARDVPGGGAYSFGYTPELSLAFFGDAITYYWLPFWSMVLVFIGGQAVGMRSMAIYRTVRTTSTTVADWVSGTPPSSATSSATPCCRRSPDWPCPSPASSPVV